MVIIYFLIAFLATTIGAMSGLGGGVIIKPMLDLVSNCDAITIGLYSSVAVFSMAVVSTSKQIIKKTPINKKMVLTISISSIVGGLIGQKIFGYATIFFNNDKTLKQCQSFLLLLILVFVLLFTINKEKIKTYHVKNNFLLIIMGLCLGSLSVFLGIGGGPLNIALLSFFFSFDLKQSVVYSITIILFSQLAKLIAIMFTFNVNSFDLFPIPFIICAGVLGGFVGSHLAKKINDAQIKKLFIYVMIVLIFICIYNFFKI